MNITEIPSIEAADLLFLSGVQLYYRGRLSTFSPPNWKPLYLVITEGSVPSRFKTFTFGVETE